MGYKCRKLIAFLLILTFCVVTYMPSYAAALTSEVDTSNIISDTDIASKNWKTQPSDFEGVINTKDLVLYNVPQGLDPIIYDYDETGLNKAVIDPLGNKTIFEYDSKGRYWSKSIKDRNDNVLYTTDYYYDDVNFGVKRLSTRNSSGKILTDYSYEYDEKENVTQEKDNLSGSFRKFTYDDANNELKEEKYFDAKGIFTNSITYSYDGAGNRVQKLVTEAGNKTTSDILNYTQNKIANVDGEQVYSYDAKGNISKDSENTYVYNDNNQLAEVKRDGKAVESYTYNDNSLRTIKTTNGEKKVYNYNGSDVLWIGDEQNKLDYLFTRDVDGRLLSMTDYTAKDPTTYWYLFDGFGNITGLADKNNSQVVKYNYDAWGNIISTEGNATTGNGKLLSEENPFRYAGYQYDQNTRYYYLNARYYDPLQGRFTSQDQYKDLKQDPRSQNLYMYGANNPVTHYDPTGNMYLVKNSSANDINDVITLQNKLLFIKDPQTAQSYYTGAIDGMFGSGTEAAVKAFQYDNGLVADGIVGDATWNKLKAYVAGDFILSLGSSGTRVTALQQELERRGLITISVDPTTGQKNYGYYGTYGPVTEEAVSNYQSNNAGLTANGMVGNSTFPVMFSTTNANARSLWAYKQLRIFKAQHDLVKITVAQTIVFADAEVPVKGGGVVQGAYGYADILKKPTGQVWYITKLFQSKSSFRRLNSRQHSL